MPGDRARERSAQALAALVVERRVAPGVQQLDLHGVDRIDVRVAQADRALHRRMPVEQLARAHDREHRVDRALVLVDHERVHAVALGALGHEVEVEPRRSAGSTSRGSSRRSRRARGRTASRGTCGAACAAPPRVSASGPSAVPTPYQAGSRQRFCVHENTHGIARSPDSSPPPAGPSRRPRADLEQRELVDRREAVEERRERLVVHERRVGLVRARARAPASRSRPRRAATVLATSGNDASSVAASACSRLRRARPGRPYLNAIVSPCSVMRRRAGAVRRGLGEDRAVRRAAAAAGAAAAAVEDRQLDRVLGRDVAEPDEPLVDRPLGGEEAAVLGRVRVADHHGQPAPALGEPAREGGRGEQLVEDPGRVLQVGDRLEERCDREVAARPPRRDRTPRARPAALAVPESTSVSSASTPCARLRLAHGREASRAGGRRARAPGRRARGRRAARCAARRPRPGAAAPPGVRRRCARRGGGAGSRRPGRGRPRARRRAA